MSEPERRFVCGTRAVPPRRPDGTYRIVCATCGGGGSTPYDTREAATSAAVKMSGRPCQCRGCGAR
jgi:hypothetical protein